MTTDNNYNDILDNVSNKISELDNLDENIQQENEKPSEGRKNSKKANLEDLKQTISSMETLINEAHTKLNFDEIKGKLENLSLQVESCNNTLLKDLYGDISGLKDLTDKVGKNIEDLQNVQNTALTSSEFEEYQKRQLELALKNNENILNEFESVKESTRNLSQNLELLRGIKGSVSDNSEFTAGIKEQLEIILSSNENVISEIKSKSDIIEQCFNSIKNIENFTAEDGLKSQADLIIKSNESIIIALNDMKESFLDTDKYFKEFENIKSSLLTDGKFEEYTKQQLDFALKTNENIYNEIDKIKENTESINSHIENLQNIQNLALTSAEFSEFQKQQLDLALKSNENIFNELNSIKEVSQNAQTSGVENIDNLKIQLENLHTNLKNYVEQIVSKLEGTPRIDDIASVVSDLNSVQQKSIKQTNQLIKDLQTGFNELSTDFRGKDFENQITKISEIYDSLNIINAWIEKVGYINQSIENVYARMGENIDFDDVAEKVDIIYENISALNSWTMKVDNIDGTVGDVQTKLSALSVCIENTRNIANTLNTLKEFIDSTFSPDIDFDDISNKMDIVYENLSSINEWANKIDTVSENISKLNTSFDADAFAGKIDDISEKISNVDEVFSKDMISSKIDLVYENIGLLNEWVSKIDDIAHKSEELDVKYTKANDSLNIKIDEIAETLSNASKIIQDVPNLKDKLDRLSGELHSITCAETKDDTDSYIYTLMDIESDFLKLYKFLDDTSKVTSQDINSLKECFSELTDDISSISIRTNKLILSADDANKQFKLYLDDFKNVIENQKNYDPDHRYLLLESKIHDMVMLVHKSVAANKNLNTAFMYLAEWIDATGCVISSIRDDIETVKTEQAKNKETPNATFDDIKLLSDKLNSLNNSIFSISAGIESIKEAQTNKPEIPNATFNDIKLLSDKLNSLNNSISSISAGIESVKEAQTKEPEIPNATFDDIKLLSEKLNSLNDSISSISADIESVKEAQTKEPEVPNATFDDIKLLSEKLNSLNDSISSISADIESVKEEQTKKPEVPNATFDDMKVLAEGLDSVNENIFELKKNIAEIKDNFDIVQKNIDAVNSVLSEVSEVNELNPVVVEMALELKNNTLQIQEFKKEAGALTSKIALLEDSFASIKTDDTAELKSMITGVMVQLNTALTPDIDSLNEKIEKVSEDNGNKFTELETLMKEKIEIQAKQINSLEEKIENLSGKFDKLIDVMGENNMSLEVKDVLSYIASQMAATNEAISAQSASSEVIKEVADKLTSFDTNINKIVSYIEE